MFPLTTDQSVARVTGESVRRIRRLGFGLPRESPRDSDANDIQLALDCPFCRRPVTFPALVTPGEPPLAECLICDVEFDFDFDEVYVLAAASSPAPALRRHAC